MIKPIFLCFLPARWLLCSLALWAALCPTVTANDFSIKRAATSKEAAPPALIEDTQAWAERADFWRLVTRGEALAERIEVLSIKSNLLEAWVCGAARVCVSTRLLRELSPETQQAVIAHEIGHLLIPRNYEAHPQLWEAQCDLFAASLLRDAELVKQMLGKLAADCANCTDQQHPKPHTRMRLLDLFSSTILTKVFKFDEFRGRSYAVQFKVKQTSVPEGLKYLSFALPPASAARSTTSQQKLEELKQLDFAVGFAAHDALSPRSKP